MSGASDPIVNFTGTHAFLSNFYPSLVVLDGVPYETVEHAFQAAKTFKESERRLIRACKKPGEAKRLGRRLTLREDWDKYRIEIMRQLLARKFSDASLSRQLLATGERELIEGNWWNDRFWGVCQRSGEGKNMLGKLLMELRERIRNGWTDN